MKNISKALKKTAVLMLTAVFIFNCIPAVSGFISAAAAEETTEINYDLSMGSKEFPLNTNTVDYSHANTALCYADCITLSDGGHYVEYDIYTDKEQMANISVFCGTNIDGGRLSISVNGEEQLTDVILGNTGGYGKRTEHKLGIITLSTGKNTIRLTRPSSSKEALVISFRNTIIMIHQWVQRNFL